MTNMPNFILPTAEGETVVFWTEDREHEPSRGVLTSNGDGAWTMTFEVGYAYLNDDPEDGLVWEQGGVFRPRDVRDFNLVLAFSRYYDRRHADVLEIMARGRCEFPLTKAVTIARVSGQERWSVKLLAAGSDHLTGHPLMSIEQSRPLTAAESFVTCTRLALALDWWNQRMGDDA